MTLTPLLLKPRGIMLMIGGLTFVIGIIVLLVSMNILSLNPLEAMPSQRYWHSLVAISGLVLPIGLLVWNRKHSIVRTTLAAYLIVLMAQIVTELLLLAWLPSNMAIGMSVMIGSLYSSARMVQLWQASQHVRSIPTSPHWLSYVLLFLLGLWSINLARFVLFRWFSLF